MQRPPTKVLLIEDNPAEARLYREYLLEDQHTRFEIINAPNLASGLARLLREYVDVVVLDLGLPDSRGFETFTKLYEHADQIAVVVLTGLEDEEIALRAVQAGAQDYLTKGQVDSVVLSRAVRYSIERKRAEEALKDYSERLRILRKVDQAILRADSAKAIAGATLPYLVRLLACLQADLVLFDDERHTAEVILSYPDTGIRPGTGRQLHMEAFAGLDELRRGVVHKAPNIQDARDRSDLEKELAADGLLSSLTVPIVVQGGLIGALMLSGHAPEICSDDQVEIALEVATSLGVALKQARLLDQISTSRDRLQRLTHRLVDLQESERRRLATELHDEIGQLLTGLKIALELDDGLSERDPRPRRVQALEVVNDLIRRTHDISLDLRPALLDDLGLLPALLWLFDHIASTTQIQVDAKHAGLEKRRLAPEIEIAAYRIVQEGLNNVARHAGVSEASVRVWIEDQILYVQIEDSGIGFEPEEVLRKLTSLGVLGMRERAYAVGGRIHIASAPDAGTRIAAELPLKGRLERREAARSDQ